MSGPAGRSKAPRVTVTHEKNKPVQLDRKRDPIQAGLGNGIASTIVFDDPLIVTAKPPKIGTPPPAPANDSARAPPAIAPPQLPGADQTRPAVAKLGQGKVDGNETGPADPAKQATADQQVVPKPPDGPAAAVAADGTITFEPVLIVGRVPDPKAAAPHAEADDGLAKLAPEDAKKTTPGGAKTPGPDVGKNEGDEPAKTSPDGKATDATAADAGPPPLANGKVVQDGKPAGETGAGGAAGSGGGGADLSAWRSKVSGAIAATPQPTLGKEPAAKVTIIGGTGKDAAARYKGGGGKAAAQVKEAVKPPPPVPKPLPPLPSTPVPAADKAIADASDKKLPEQTLPALVRRPGDASVATPTVPMVNLDLGSDLGSKIDATDPAAPPAPDAKDDKARPDAKKVEKVKQAAAKKPEPRKGQPGEKLVLGDTMPPPAPRPETGTRGQDRGTVLQVLAELKRNPGPQGEAHKIVGEARAEAYPRKAVEMEYPTLGDGEKEGAVKTELEKQVDGIAQVVGASQAELDAAMKTREATLKAMQEGVKVEIETAGKGARKDVEKAGKEAAADIWAARQAQDDDTIRKAEAATGESDPVVIELKRDKAVRDLTYRAARQDIYYEKSGERRARALDATHTRYKNAFSQAARGDQDQIFKRLVEAEKKSGKKPADAEKAAHDAAEIEAKPVFEWWAKQSLALGAEFSALKDKAAASTKEYRTGIKSALEKAQGLLSDWAEDKISAQESWWDSIVRAYREWMAEARTETEAWEAARNEELRNSLTGDLQLLDDLQGAARQGVDMKGYIEERGLDAAQMEVIKTYFGRVGPKGQEQFDAVGAVAAGMRMRVRAVRKPELLQWFKDQVLGMPDGDWKHLGAIGNAEKPPFNVAALGSKLWHAMDQWGTDEDEIFAALAGLTPVQARAIRAWYQVHHHRSLDEHIRSEMSDAELKRAEALLEGDQAMADAATLYEAMHGGLTGIGTDEDAIMRVLRNKSPEEQRAIIAAYRKQYGDLDADLKDELDDGFSSHHDFDRATALREGDVAKADAIGIDAAMHGGLGLGTEEGDITKIYEQNRAEVEDEGARKGWTTEQVNLEIARRNKAIEDKYEGKYGDPNKPRDQPSALRQAFASEMSDAELRLANALADGDAAKIDAEKLAVEKESFITSDDTVNAVLANQGKRARKDVERDANVDLQVRAEADSLRGKPWDSARWGEERKATQEQIEKDTKARALEYMGKVEGAFDKQYGKGGLVLLIAFNVSGYDQKKAFDLRAQGGILEPEQEIHYAIAGIGTDLDKLKDTLKGKSPADVEKIRQAWAKRYHRKPEEFDAEILDDVSGRDERDMIWALEGEPQTLDAKLKRAEERRDYEKSAYGIIGDYKEERAVLDAEYSDVIADYKKVDAEQRAFEEAKKTLGAPQGKAESDADYAKRQAQLADLGDRLSYHEEGLKLNEGYFNTAIEDHRKAVDEFADTAATIAGIVATVVVMAVVAFFTAGTGAAAIGAALASAKVAAAAAIAAAAATMATKQLIKGSAYTREELATDAITGAVDAVASAMTAGVGGSLLKGARAGAPTSRLAAWAAKSKLGAGLSKLATSERMAARMFAGAMAEGIEGVAQTLPSALAGNILNEQNWVKGNPLANILQGTVMQTGMGAAVSGGMGALGGIAKHVPEGPAARETGDILAKRGSPADRLAAWKSWKLDNPGQPYKSFLDEFDAGILTKEADDAAKHALQRQMRGELLGAIPASERKAFAQVPIEVLSEADFERLTKSASGQAAVLFRDGKPVVFLREGADLKVLREEGIHLVQSKDPKFAKAFKSLDETNLARWSKMGLDEQLSLYRTKIDIELDAQARLLKTIEADLAGAQDPAMRKMLLAQRDAAQTTLVNLEKRLGEVLEISPLDRLKMAKGELLKPQYLEQEPRLFAKKTAREALAAKDPGFAKVLQRFSGAGSAASALVGLLGGSKTGQAFADIFKNFRDRGNTFLSSVTRGADGKKVTFAAFLKNVGGEARFDTTLAMRALVDAATFLHSSAGAVQLSLMLRSVGSLIGNVRIAVTHVEPFLRLVDKMPSPQRLFRIVEEVAELPSFRRNGLPNLADAIESVATGKPKLLDEFLDRVEQLSSLAGQRDSFAKGTTGWTKAQNKLSHLAQAMEKETRFGIPPKRYKRMLEEFARTGAFNWDVFRKTLTNEYPVKGHSFKPMKDLVESLKRSVGADWVAENAGPILRWSSVVQHLQGKIGAAKAKSFIADLESHLLTGLTNPKAKGKGLTPQIYGAYREKIQKVAMAHIFEATSAKGQFDRMTAVMAFLRKDGADPGTIGEYFADFRRKIFEGGKVRPIQGPLSGATDMPHINRKIGNDPVRMVDGAMHVPKASAGSGGPRRPGLYFLEDKAGSSFDLDQAINYDKQLRAGKLKSVNSAKVEGLIYFVEDPTHAASINQKLAKEGLHPDILVATFNAATGQIHFLKRPSVKSAVPPPPTRKIKAKK